MNRPSPTVEIEAKIEYDRPMSYGIRHPNDPRGRIVFLPRKLCTALTEVGELKGGFTRLEIPEWLALREGLI